MVVIVATSCCYGSVGINGGGGGGSINGGTGGSGSSNFPTNSAGYLSTNLFVFQNGNATNLTMINGTTFPATVFGTSAFQLNTFPYDGIDTIFDDNPKTGLVLWGEAGYGGDVVNSNLGPVFSWTDNNTSSITDIFDIYNVNSGVSPFTVAFGINSNGLAYGGGISTIAMFQKTNIYDFYVAPWGSDTNFGTSKEFPLATFTNAYYHVTNLIGSTAFTLNNGIPNYQYNIHVINTNYTIFTSSSGGTRIASGVNLVGDGPGSALLFTNANATGGSGTSPVLSLDGNNFISGLYMWDSASTVISCLIGLSAQTSPVLGSVSNIVIQNCILGCDGSVIHNENHTLATYNTPWGTVQNGIYFNNDTIIGNRSVAVLEWVKYPNLIFNNCGLLCYAYNTSIGNNGKVEGIFEVDNSFGAYMTNGIIPIKMNSGYVYISDAGNTNGASIVSTSTPGAMTNTTYVISMNGVQVEDSFTNPLSYDFNNSISNNIVLLNSVYHANGLPLTFQTNNNVSFSSILASNASYTGTLSGKGSGLTNVPGDGFTITNNSSGLLTVNPIVITNLETQSVTLKSNIIVQAGTTNAIGILDTNGLHTSFLYTETNSSGNGTPTLHVHGSGDYALMGYDGANVSMAGLLIPLSSFQTNEPEYASITSTNGYIQNTSTNSNGSFNASFVLTNLPAYKTYATNFANLTTYTNTTGRPISVWANITYGTASVAGISKMEIESPGTITNTSTAQITIIGSLVQNIPGSVGPIIVPAGSNYLFRDMSTGIGVSCTVSNGQIQIQ